MQLSMTVLRCPDQVAPEARTVSGGEFHVGRGPAVDWVLPDPERLLSKRHFAVAFRGGGWQVADTSTNGTYLNNEPDAIGRGATRALRDGDRLRLGAYEIEIRLVDQPAQGDFNRGAAGGGFGAGAGARSGQSPFGDPFADDPLAPSPAARRPFDEPAYSGLGVAPTNAQLPHDFDPLAPDRDEPAFGGGFRGPVQSDHSSSMEDAMIPPPIAGFSAPQTGGIIPGDDLLPDDWDKDLEGLAPPSPTPAPFPSPSRPVQPSASFESAAPSGAFPGPAPHPVSPAPPPSASASSLASGAAEPVDFNALLEDLAPPGEPVRRAEPPAPPDTSSFEASPFAEPRPAVPPLADAPNATPLGPTPLGPAPLQGSPPAASGELPEPFDFNEPLTPPTPGPGTHSLLAAEPSPPPPVAPPAMGNAPVVRQREPRSAMPRPAPSDADPFTQPAARHEPELRQPPPSAPARTAPIANAAASPFDEPTDQPASGPGPTPPEPRKTAVAATDDGGAVAAFFKGADLKGAIPADPVSMMTGLGQAFRALVSGLRQVLIARATIKGEFRIEQTMIRARGNNPLKFSANDDDALTALLGVGRRTDMAPAAAIEDSLRDLRLHELATMAAMQVAVRAMLEELSPDKIRAGTDQGGIALLPAQRKARAWDAYEARHTAVVRALVDDFDSIFGKSFARAYERALDEISLRERQ